MENIIVKETRVQFSDLLEDVQKKLYLQEPSTFTKEASRSVYKSVQRLVVENEETSSQILDEMFERKLEDGRCDSIFPLIWKHPNFQKTEEKRQRLTKAKDEEFCLIVAKDEDSSSPFLNQMLRDKMQEGMNLRTIVEILRNTKLQLEEETEERFTKGKVNWKIKEEAAKRMNSCPILNKLYRKEIDEYNYWEKSEEVLDAIEKNDIFQMEEETREKLASSDIRWSRVRAARDKGSSSEFLNQMYRDEMKRHCDEVVLNAIEENENFQMEEKLSEDMKKSRKAIIRKRVVCSEKSSSKLLNEMFRNEVKDERLQCRSVIEAIRDNTNFQIEEETIEVLANSKLEEVREMAIEEESISTEVLMKMYQVECSDMLKRRIEKKLKSRELEQRRKEELRNLLEDLRINKRKSVEDYVDQIIEMFK